MPKRSTGLAGMDGYAQKPKRARTRNMQRREYFWPSEVRTGAGSGNDGAGDIPMGNDGTDNVTGNIAGNDGDAFNFAFNFGEFSGVLSFDHVSPHGKSTKDRSFPGHEDTHGGLPLASRRRRQH